MSKSDFIMKWRITDVDTRVMFYAAESEFDVDWGDGCNERVSKGAIAVEHCYDAPGDYIVKTNNEIKSFSLGYATMTARNLIDVIQWGSAQWVELTSAFYGCTGMTMSATDAPDLSKVTDLSFMFYKCKKFNTDINHWDVSNVDNMRSMFSLTDVFNQPLDKWDVGNVAIMEHMFSGALSFNQPLEQWDIKSVKSMNYMLRGATNFWQSLERWRERKTYPHSYKTVAFLFGTGSEFGSSMTFDEYLAKYEKKMADNEKDFFKDILTQEK